MEQLPHAHLHNYFYSALRVCGTMLYKSEHVSSINPLCLGRQFCLTTTRVLVVASHLEMDCRSQPPLKINS